jgi:cytochrome P450
MVILNLYGIHHNPTVWPDPERFRPERFTREEIAQRSKHAWLPFGAGPRACIGREFALMEAQLALAMLLQRFSLSAVPGRRPTAQARMTLRPEGGVQVYLRRRPSPL